MVFAPFAAPAVAAPASGAAVAAAGFSHTAPPVPG